MQRHPNDASVSKQAKSVELYRSNKIKYYYSVVRVLLLNMYSK